MINEDERAKRDIERIFAKTEEVEEITEGLGSLTGRQSLETPLVEIPELVNNWVRAGDITLLIGSGGVGKSILAKHLGCALAGGVDFLGYGVSSNEGALYLDLEMGEYEFRMRLNMLLPQYPEVARDNFRWKCLSNFTIKDKRNYARLRNELALVRPKLLIIDNHASFHGGDPNKESDMMVNVILPLRDLMVEFSLGVLYLMHTPWTERDRPRGSMALFDAAASVIAVTRPQGDTRKLKWTKRRSVRSDMGAREIEISYNATNYMIYPSAGMAVNDILNSVTFPVKQPELVKTLAQGLGITPTAVYNRLKKLFEGGQLIKEEHGMIERGMDRLTDYVSV